MAGGEEPASYAGEEAADRRQQAAASRYPSHVAVRATSRLAIPNPHQGVPHPLTSRYSTSICFARRMWPRQHSAREERQPSISTSVHASRSAASR
eukprot:scaffold2305_cov60-Phaeocystis_antarctica.AAC.3